MKIPGFTAEASIYQTKNTYQGVYSIGMNGHIESAQVATHHTPPYCPFPKKLCNINGEYVCVPHNFVCDF